MLLHAGRRRTEKPVIIHTLYYYWWLLPRASPFVFHVGDRRQDAGWRFILQPRQQRRSQLSLISLLIIIPPNNLPADTFDNIMWSRSEVSANETEWGMLLSAALTLLIVVTGNAFTHASRNCDPAEPAQRILAEVVHRHVWKNEITAL